MENTNIATWNRSRTEEELESFLSRREAFVSSMSE